MAQWRTIGPNGQLNMMTDLSPIEYKSLHDIAAPYSQALKDQYLGRIDRYRYWKGIDESQIRNALSTVATDIFNTPQGQAWYRDISAELAMQGVTDPNAVREEMMNRLVQSQKDYMRKNMEYDTAAIQEDTIALKRRIAAGKEQPDNPPARYTDMIRLDGKRYLNSLVNYDYDSSLNNENVRKANMELMIANTTGNKNRIADAQAKYDIAVNKANEKSFNDMIHDNFTQAIGREYRGTNLSGYELVNGTKSVVDLLSTDNSLDGAHAILGQVANVSTKEDGTIKYTMKDSRYLENPVTVVASMEGVKVDKNFKLFDRLLREGKFKNLQVEPATYGGLFNYIDKDGKFKQKQRVYVTVKESDILTDDLSFGQKALFDTYLAMNGAQTVNKSSSNRLSETETKRMNEDGELEGTTISVTKSNAGENYITFEAFVNVPDDETGYQGTMVTNINSAYDRTNMTGSQAGKVYPLQQADAFYSNPNAMSLDQNIDLDEILSE